ncbi:MAG: hypothetical protein IPL67_17950 [Ignavibacteria bacterium]|nr:hypothetical protein [Ignavibacteria bacterium]
MILAFNATADALIRNVPAITTLHYTECNFACNNGDTVPVQPGTYFENINFSGTKRIVLTSRFF